MQRLLAVSFLLLAIVSAGLDALLVPFSEVPDEPAHIARADSVTHGNLIGRRGPDREVAGRQVADAGVTANQGLIFSTWTFAATAGSRGRGLTQAGVEVADAWAWMPRPSYVSAINTASYPPIFYLPAAAGLWMAHRAGWTPWRSIHAARLCNVLAYAVAGAAALLVARRAHALLLAALLLPMSLYLAGSVNQDGVLIGVAVLAAALLTRARTVPAPMAAPTWIAAPTWTAALALAPVIAAKPAYLPLAGLLLLTAARGRTRVFAAALAGLPGLGWFLLARRLAAVPFPLPAPYASGPLWPGPAASFIVTDPALQIQTLLHRPALLVLLPWRAMAAEPGVRLREMVGVFGQLDLLLPDLLYPVWYAALGVAVAALLAAAPSSGRPTSGQSGGTWGVPWGITCIVAAVFAIYVSQYLTWSPVGADEIAGVQGRYFIPLLPFLAFAMPGVPVRWGAAAGAAACVPVVLAAVIGAVAVPVQAVATYYLR